MDKVKFIMYFIIPIFFGIVHYNIYRSDYRIDKQFVEAIYNTKVTRVEDNKGVRVYIDNKKYYYFKFPMSVRPKKGDRVLKEETSYKLFRNNRDNELELIEELNLKSYFFNNYYDYYLHRVWDIDNRK